MFVAEAEKRQTAGADASLNPNALLGHYHRAVPTVFRVRPAGARERELRDALGPEQLGSLVESESESP